MKRTLAILLALGLVLLLASCGGSSDMMGPRTPGPSLLSVTPPDGATGVSASTAVVFRFGAAMGVGMEQLVDLHVGDLGGPIVPLRCGWSADRTTLTCTPQAPLPAHTACVAHLGGGLMTQAGQPLEYGARGGHWVLGSMMGGTHAGGAWRSMGPRWRGPNGSYGMAFTFTTA
jgi:hypothetical protein